MLTLPVTTPFSFAQSLAFIGAFRPCRDAVVMTADSVTAAVAIGGKPYAFTLRERGKHLVVELADDTPRPVQKQLVERATHFVGSTDDLAPFYAAAAGDPVIAKLVEEMHGLHHVRFLTLEESVVYSILMQRAPMPVAAALKRRFLAGLGLPVEVKGQTIHAFPELGDLAKLDESDFVKAIKHAPKAKRIAGAVRAVHAIGEELLRTAPYEEARDALLEIDGIGPFAATAILLRGLGRMDALPWMPHFEQAARKIYGKPVTEAAITKRYGRHIGYWSFYVMTGVGRRERALH